MNSQSVLYEHERKMNVWSLYLLWGCVMGGFLFATIARIFVIESTVPLKMTLLAWTLGIMLCITVTAFNFKKSSSFFVKYLVVISLILIVLFIDLFVASKPSFTLWIWPVIISCLYFIPLFAAFTAVLNFMIFFIPFLTRFNTSDLINQNMVNHVIGFPLTSAILIALAIQARRMLLILCDREREQGEMVKNMEAIVAKAKETSGKVSESGRVLVKMVVRNETSVQDMASVAVELSSTVEEVSASLSEISEYSSRVAKAASEGGESIKEIYRQMDFIKMLVQSLAEMIRKLNLSSKKIGEVINIISSVAEQTNLLSLNAAIEAARAGDHGKGFAVVADEVRKLAENSGRASGEIASLVKVIQSEANGVSKTMEDGLASVDKGVNLIRHTGEGLEGIIELINNVARQITEISQAVKEVEKGGMQVAGTSEEQLNFTNKIADEAKNLNVFAEDLYKSLDG